MFTDTAISGDRNVIKKENKKDSKIQKAYSTNTAHVECENKRYQ